MNEKEWINDWLIEWIKMNELMIVWINEWMEKWKLMKDR